MFQSPQSGIFFCNQYYSRVGREAENHCFNPLNLGSSFATPRPLHRPRTAQVRFQSPQSGIFFCNRDQGDMDPTGRELGFNPLNLGSSFATGLDTRVELNTGTRFNPLNLGSSFATSSSSLCFFCFYQIVSIPSIWDLLLQLPSVVESPSGSFFRFNPLNLGSSFATHYRT